MRQYQFLFTIECATDAEANLEAVESMIDLNMQELVFNDAFVQALGETESVTIQVLRKSGVDKDL